MGAIQYIAMGWLGAGVVLVAIVATIAWQALPELDGRAEDRSTATKWLAHLAKIWLPLVIIASLLTLLRVAALT